jgi:FkbM family methyltransferase
MEKKFNQASSNFLMKILERFSRKNIFVYHWARKFLPLYVYLTGTPHERFFMILKKIPERPGILLDVGASDGLSVISMRTLNKNSPILSLEPNPEQKGILKLLAKLIGNYQFKLVGAGEKPEDLTLYTPVYKGYSLASYATLNPELFDLPRYGMFTDNYNPSLLSFVKNTVKIVPIDSLNLNIDFVKIDAEGAELSVLNGMLSTIERCRPVIMVERVNFSISEIQNLLQSFNYQLVNSTTAEFVPEEEVADEPNLVFWPVGLTPKN